VQGLGIDEPEGAPPSGCPSGGGGVGTEHSLIRERAGSSRVPRAAHTGARYGLEPLDGG
jgi:hypothetical protein